MIHLYKETVVGHVLVLVSCGLL